MGQLFLKSFVYFLLYSVAEVVAYAYLSHKELPQQHWPGRPMCTRRHNMEIKYKRNCQFGCTSDDSLYRHNSLIGIVSSYHLKRKTNKVIQSIILTRLCNLIHSACICLYLECCLQGNIIVYAFVVLLLNIDYGHSLEPRRGAVA